jgi:hypothetical protein
VPSVSGTLGLLSFLALIAGRVLDHSPELGRFLWPCPLKAVTGIPCFTCGITRIYVMLGRGDVVDAFLLAPLPFFLVLGTLGAGAWQLWARAKGKPLPDDVIGRWIDRRRNLALTLLVICLLWGYAIYRSHLTGAP